MQKILCDECEKEKCPQRLKGSLCMINDDIKGLAVVLETRDPVLFARKFVGILESEVVRYEKAKGMEGIGEEEKFTYTDKKGEVKTIKKKKGIDSRVSGLALNILKGAKIINEIIHPKDSQQQPLIGNQNILIVNELMSLPEAYRALFVKKFIDDKLDASEKNRAITVPSDS